MEFLSEQVRAFAMTVGAGVLLGILFDLYRVFRGWVQPGRWMTAICDLLFWAVATPILFAYLLLANWAELRLYVLAGVGIGLVCYYAVISVWVIRGVSAAGRGILGGLATLCSSVLRIVLAPILVLIEGLSRGGALFRRNRWSGVGAGGFGRIWPRNLRN